MAASGWLISCAKVDAISPTVIRREVRVSYTHVVRTREFRTQPKHDEFGALTISIPF